MKRTQPIPRRAILRGLVGGALAAVGLPTLEAMLSSHGTALADGNPLPVRLITWCFGNGVVLNRWVPGGIRTPVTGPGYPVSNELKPFFDAGVGDYVSICSGFDNKCKYQITHHEGMTIWSGHTMTDIGQGAGYFSNARGPTMDQVAAQMIGARTAIPSLQLGCITEISQADYGTTMHNLSHKDHLQPLPPQKNPQAAFLSLMGLFSPVDDPNKPSRLSVVDSVREDLKLLKTRLGMADQIRMDAHMEGLAELEAKINALTPLCVLPAMPTATADNVDGIRPVNEAMADLIAFAFSCDITRIASYLFVGGAAEAGFPEIGTPSQHGLSHNHNTNALDPSAPPYAESGEVDQMDAGVNYEMQMAAYLAQKLHTTPDAAGGNLLDQTVMMVSSDCSEGFAHSLVDFPLLVIGKAGGRLKYPGEHFRDESHRNASDVVLSVLQAVVPEATEVGSLAPAYQLPEGNDPAYSNTPFAEIKAGS